MLQLFHKNVDKVNPTCSLDDLSTIISFKKITSTAKTFLHNNKKEKNSFSEINKKTINDSILNLINANEISKDAIGANSVRIHQNSKSTLPSKTLFMETNKVKPKNTKKKNQSREDLLRDVCMKNTYLVYKCLDPYHKGYIDIDEVVNQFEGLSGYHNFHSILHRLISILEDLKCVISHNGVIEKRDAIVNLYHFISEAGRTCPVYSLLQTHSHKLSNELQKLYNKENTMKPFYAHKPYEMVSTLPKKLIPYAYCKTGQINSDLHVINPPFYKSPSSPTIQEYSGIQPFTIPRKESHVIPSKKWKENNYEMWKNNNKNSSSDSDTQFNCFLYPFDLLNKKAIKTRRRKHQLLKTGEGYQNFMLNPTALRLNNYNLNTHRQSFNSNEDEDSLQQVFVHSLNTHTNKETNNKQSSSTTHYVIHNGEPPRQPYPKWEDDLRVSLFENFSYNYCNFKTSAT